MPRFRADRRLQLLSRTPDSNPVQANGVAWTTIATVWGSKEDTRASRRGEYLAGDQFRDIAYTLFTVRYNATYQAVERVVCDGITYQVIGYPIEIGRHRFLEIMAVKSQ